MDQREENAANIKGDRKAKVSLPSFDRLRTSSLREGSPCWGAIRNEVKDESKGL